MPAGETQGDRDNPGRGEVLPAFGVLLRIQYPGPDDTNNFYKYFLNVLRTAPTPAFSSVK